MQRLLGLLLLPLLGTVFFSPPLLSPGVFGRLEVPPVYSYNTLGTLHIDVTEAQPAGHAGHFLVAYRNTGYFSFGALAWGVWTNPGDVLNYPLTATKTLYFNLAATRWISLDAFRTQGGGFSNTAGIYAANFSSYVAIGWVDDADLAGYTHVARYNGAWDNPQTEGTWDIEHTNVQAQNQKLRARFSDGNVRDVVVKTLYDDKFIVLWARYAAAWNDFRGQIRLGKLDNAFTISGDVVHSFTVLASATVDFHVGVVANIAADVFQRDSEPDRFYFLIAYLDVTGGALPTLTV